MAPRWFDIGPVNWDLLRQLLGTGMVAMAMYLPTSLVWASEDVAATASVAVSEHPERLEGHGGPIRAVVLNRRGDQALTTSFDYSAIHWSFADGKATILSRLFGHDAAVNDIVFVDEKTAASVSDDGSLVIWDLPDGKVRARVTGTGDKILDIDVAPDGKTVAVASWDQVARIHDTQTGALVAEMKGHRGNVNGVRFSADGKTLYTISYDGTLRSWESATGAFKRRLADHGWAINVLERQANNNLVYGLLDGTVFILDPETGEQRAELKKHQGPVLAVAAARSGDLVATGGGDGRIFISNTKSGELVEEFENPYGPVWSVAIAPDNAAIYYAGLDDFVSVWTVNPRKPFETVDSVYPRRFQVSKDVELGEREFARKCSICHTLEKDGKFRAGPTLFGVFGRKAGTYPGYPYSDALLKADFVWDDETIDKLFALGPHEFTPGSKMPLQRIRSEKKRLALIAYLRRVTDPDNTEPLPGSSKKSSSAGNDAAQETTQEK